jgi:hypothetical protein
MGASIVTIDAPLIVVVVVDSTVTGPEALSVAGPVDSILVFPVVLIFVLPVISIEALPPIFTVQFF